MATKKYLSLERLGEYDELIKGEISSGDAASLSAAKTYTNTEISKITSGNTAVPKADHATSADSATTAASADTSAKLTTARTISLSGDASGSVSFDGTEDVSITVTVADDSHNHVISNVDGLQSALDGKAAKTHSHDDLYYTETEVDTLLSGKSDKTHNHDSAYDAKGAADTALASAKSYTDTKVTGMATTTVVDNKISAHNTSNTAHSDIRNLISDLTTKVNNFLDVDDTTTDQLSEVLTLISNNKGTLDSLLSDKVNVSDIVDNLTTASASKVLSANQGVALKALIDALEAVVDGKADEVHTHAITDVTGLQSALDGKAAASHGTHVTFDSTNKPKMDGTAAFGTSTSVARADHVHPTDTSRASKTEFDTHTTNTTVHITSTERTNWNAAKTHADSAHAPSNAQANIIESIKVNGTAQSITSKSVNIVVPTVPSDIGAAAASHTHAISEITNLETTLNNASGAILANASSIEAHTARIVALEGKVGDGFEEISSAEIQNLFK